ncbi:MAG: lipocalin-like domain-containing protein [Acidobacteria bacterium]|nr:lipocalin-like domain-containing protein [Acidobacteriota bacterium]
MKQPVVLLLAVAGIAFAAPVTFHKDVEPVLQKHCQGCHRPGEAAPMSFLTYASTRPWAKAIKQAVLAKRMPPWFADPDHGKFQNDPTLSDAERNAIAQWADSGSIQGDPKSAPPPLTFTGGWNIGVPEHVIEMPNDFSVPAAGVIEYQHVVVPTGLTEDKWVRAVELRPGNRAVVHHIIAFVRPPGSKWLRDVQPGVPVTDRVRLRNLSTTEMPEFLLSYTPGRPPAGLANGQARLIPAGSDIVFQLHYTTNGKPATDRSKLGLIFAKEPPRERVATLPIANSTFVIPPGDPNHRVDAVATVDQPAQLLRLIPHMHLRGKAFEVSHLRPGQDPRVLLRVPKYDFNWQNAYSLDRPISLNPGDKIAVSGWFDNSPNNPHNPDPKAEVRWGDQSWEEMMLNYIDISVQPKEEPKRVIARPAPVPQAPPAASVRDRFIGTWRLASFDSTLSDGTKTKPYGDAPEGRIQYEKSGRMSAMLMRTDRKNISAASLEAAPLEALRDATTGFTAYYGTFDIDESKKIVTHHLKFANNPNWVGTDLVRSYQFENNTLILTATSPARAGATLRLVWERLPD